MRFHNRKHLDPILHVCSQKWKEKKIIDKSHFHIYFTRITKLSVFSFRYMCTCVCGICFPFDGIHVCTIQDGRTISEYSKRAELGRLFYSCLYNVNVMHHKSTTQAVIIRIKFAEFNSCVMAASIGYVFVLSKIYMFYSIFPAGNLTESILYVIFSHKNM